MERKAVRRGGGVAEAGFEKKKAKLGVDDLQVAYTLQLLGVCLRDGKRYDEAEEVLIQGLEIEKKKLGEDDLQVAYTLQSLGVYLRNAMQYEETAEVFMQALEIEKKHWARAIFRSQ